MRIALLVSLLASSTLTFAQTTPEEMAFKDAFIKAAKANDTVAIMALTCLDGVTPEWKTMLEGSYKHIFPQFQEQEPETVTFTPFSGPQPEPIKYKDIFLIPNIPITTICKFEWPKTDTKGFQLNSTEIRLGRKDGKLVIVSLIPQN